MVMSCGATQSVDCASTEISPVYEAAAAHSDDGAVEPTQRSNRCAMQHKNGCRSLASQCSADLWCNRLHQGES